MEIISHRGYWLDFAAESNRKVAFERSFDKGFGTETDLRDYHGEVVISHDMPNGSEISFIELLEIMDGRNLKLALNIKADGLAKKIEHILTDFGHTNYFTFDMSIPEMVYESQNTSLIFYSGCSDVNPVPPLYDEASGIWLDSFGELWYSTELVLKHVENKKEVCIVSEDLHNRGVDDQWKMIKETGIMDIGNVVLCTNYPERAFNYFFGE